MKHVKRKWCHIQVASAEELAIRLTESRWDCSTAFVVVHNPKYAWLNDSASDEAVQEYSVVKHISGSRWLYLESITFGCHDYQGALTLILTTLNGQDDFNVRRRSLQISIEPQRHHWDWCLRI